MAAGRVRRRAGEAGEEGGTVGTEIDEAVAETGGAYSGAVNRGRV